MAGKKPLHNPLEWFWPNYLMRLNVQMKWQQNTYAISRIKRKWDTRLPLSLGNEVPRHLFEALLLPLCKLIKRLSQDFIAPCDPRKFAWTVTARKTLLSRHVKAFKMPLPIHAKLNSWSCRFNICSLYWINLEILSAVGISTRSILRIHSKKCTNALGQYNWNIFSPLGISVFQGVVSARCEMINFSNKTALFARLYRNIWRLM